MKFFSEVSRRDSESISIYYVFVVRKKFARGKSPARDRNDVGKILQVFCDVLVRGRRSKVKDSSSTPTRRAATCVLRWRVPVIADWVTKATGPDELKLDAAEITHLYVHGPDPFPA